MQRENRSGFTLVELAIVLVIIGLITGGVLVGQDLIKAASIRSAITDIEKFNAAATTFLGKYNGLPGDLSAPKAVQFGLAGAADPNSTGAAGLRDGNGILMDGTGLIPVNNLSGETALFWKDLGASALIPGTYPGIGTAVGPAAAVTAATVNTYLPRSKLRNGTSFHAYSVAGRNYFYLATLAAVITTGQVTAGDGVTPLEAKSIDEKLDDGAPLSGVALAYNDLATIEPTANATTACVTMSSTYNVADSATYGAPNTVVCQLRIRASF